MLLLSCAVRNHGSIHGEVVLDLTRPSLRTLRPSEGGAWADQVYSVAGIFGANASGKSTVLDALCYVFTAVRDSARVWQGHKGMPWHPYRLVEGWEASTSEYLIDFVLDGRRYEYSFEVDARGVVAETLRDLPSSRWRRLVHRTRESLLPRTHPSIGEIGPVAPRELALSRAELLDHSRLAPIARSLVHCFDITTVTSPSRDARLSAITRGLADGSIDFDDVVALLQIADIGVEDVSVHEEALPADLAEVFALVRKQRERKASSSEASDRDGGDPQVPGAQLGAEQSEAVAQQLLFTHSGPDHGHAELRIADESDGTLAWLALSVPALEVLRTGGIYCIDEIDSSLHPHLVDLILQTFADPIVNTHGAQLLFTSHETYVLSNLSDVELEPAQIWFTEKDGDGVTTLFSLADFPRHRDANVAKRYLLGRYGATPRLRPSMFGRLLDVDSA